MKTENTYINNNKNHSTTQNKDLRQKNTVEERLKGTPVWCDLNEISCPRYREYGKDVCLHCVFKKEKEEIG